MTNKIFDFIKLLYKDASRLHIGMFAGNASFFFFLCAIPLFTLIFLTMFSILKLDPVMIGKQMDVFLGFLPDKITPFVLDNFEWLQNYISEKIKFSWTLVLFFCFSTYGLFNNIWKGVDLILDLSKSKRKKIYSSLGILVLSLLSFIILFIGPLVIELIASFTQLNFKGIVIFDNIILNTLLDIKNYNYIFPFLLIFQISIFYYFFFSKKISYFGSLLSSTILVSGIYSLKFLLKIYMANTVMNPLFQSNLILTLVLVFLWVYLSFTLFYFVLVLIKNMPVFYKNSGPS